MQNPDTLEPRMGGVETKEQNPIVAILHCGNYEVETSIIFYFQHFYPNIKLIPLRQIILDLHPKDKGLVEATFSPKLSECIGLQEIGGEQHIPIIWEPTPMHDDWFKRLAEDGHTGPKILLYTAWSMWGQEKDFGSDATKTIQFPTDDPTMWEKIAKALKNNL